MDLQTVVYATGGWDENNVPHLYNGTVAVVKSSNNSMTLGTLPNNAHGTISRDVPAMASRQRLRQVKKN